MGHPDVTERQNGGKIATAMTAAVLHDNNTTYTGTSEKDVINNTDYADEHAPTNDRHNAVEGRILDDKLSTFAQTAGMEDFESFEDTLGPEDAKNTDISMANGSSATSISDLPNNTAFKLALPITELQDGADDSTAEDGMEDTVMPDAPAATNESAANDEAIAQALSKDTSLAAKPTKRIALTPTTAPTPKTRKGTVWSADTLLTSFKSKLVNADLVVCLLCVFFSPILLHRRRKAQLTLSQPMLASDAAWDLLDSTQKQRILSLLPPSALSTSDTSSPECKPLTHHLKYNKEWKHAIAHFQEHLAMGHLDPKWLAEAEQAGQERLGESDKFDKWKENNFEEFWGQRQRLDTGALAGEASRIKMLELVQKGRLRVGDVWTYSRRVLGTMVEKGDVRVTGANTQGYLTFSLPPGKKKNSSPTVKDLTIEDAGGPGLLETTILNAGGLVDAPNGNAWKCFRVFRDNQDLGLLFEIRDVYNLELAEKNGGNRGSGRRKSTASNGRKRKAKTFDDTDDDEDNDGQNSGEDVVTEAPVATRSGRVSKPATARRQSVVEKATSTKGRKPAKKAAQKRKPTEEVSDRAEDIEKSVVEDHNMDDDSEKEVMPVKKGRGRPPKP
jgi:Asx homology domain